MIRRPALLVLALLALAGCRTAAPPAAPDGLGSALAQLDTLTLFRHTSALAADSMEGRGTGTRGEERAVAYLEGQMRAAGLEGAFAGGSFRQRVPLRGATPTTVSDLRFDGPGGTVAARFFDEFIAATDLDAARAALDALPVVFVGYGIANPGVPWDDYKDVDVRGKVLIGFVNEPPATAAEPRLFGADTLTYNGRWTYKYEEARRRGAAGMFLIHTTPTAGYGFQVLQGSARGEQIALDAPLDGAMTLRGWIVEPVAEALAQASGSTLAAWFAEAARRDFRPRELPVRVSASAAFETRRFAGTNVVGVLRGSEMPGEGVIYTGHHDHLGIRADGEIYNGAVDNAAGLAKVLAVARAFASLPERPRRSVFFATVTAEESGLLGSAYLAQNPPVPARDLIANLNLDGANLNGLTADVTAIGAERSDLMRFLRPAAAAEGLSVSPDAQPGQGFFFRSDQLSFARVGVPGVFFVSGSRFVGQPPDYAERVFAEYNRLRYHQPGDEMRPEMRWGGLAQQARVAFRMGLALADSDTRPAWNAAEPFAETRRLSEAR